jgi:hypothetical protein
MKTPFRIFATLSTCVVFLSVALPGAQPPPPDTEEDDRPRIILFERPNFRGDSIELRAGDSLENLGHMRYPSGRKANDSASSILIEEGASVTVFTAARFEGESLRLNRSVENLADLQVSSSETWNDAISSVRSELSRGGPVRGRGGREPRAILYRDPHYRGDSIEVFPGDNFDNLSRISFDGGRNANDAVSSIRIVGGVRLIVFAAAGYGMDSFEVTEDIDDLSKLPQGVSGRGTWDNSISSLRVERGSHGDGAWSGNRPGGQRPPPRSMEEPEVVIKRLVKEVLGREATDADIRVYRRRIIDDNWNADMIRADLQRSREYRLKGADVIIRRAYQDLLNRDPDPQGLEHYRSMIIDEGWTERRLRDAIRSGQEYKDLQRAKQPPVPQTPPPRPAPQPSQPQDSPQPTTDTP